MDLATRQQLNSLTRNKEKSLIRLSVRFASAAALVVLSVPSARHRPRQQVPPAPAPGSSTAPAARACSQHLPLRRVSQARSANFTAASPTKETIKPSCGQLGLRRNRIWQVQAILKTPVDGISKVIVFVGDKTGKEKPSALEFFALARRQAHHHRRPDRRLR